jgi:hypothetical protein
VTPASAYRPANRLPLPALTADAMTDPIRLPESTGAVPRFDHARAERAVRELLIAIGEDP